MPHKLWGKEDSSLYASTSMATQQGYQRLAFGIFIHRITPQLRAPTNLQSRRLSKRTPKQPWMSHVKGTTIMMVDVPLELVVGIPTNAQPVGGHICSHIATGYNEVQIGKQTEAGSSKALEAKAEFLL